MLAVLVFPFPQFAPPPPRIDPQALALTETMARAYRSVRSFRCTIESGAPSPETTRLLYRRPGRLLIQRLSPQGELLVEYRVVDGKALVSSPGSPRYLRAPLGPGEKPFEALQSRVFHATALFGQMLDGGAYLTPDDFKGAWAPSGRLAALSLGPRAVAEDGTPVDVLIEDRVRVDPFQHAQRPVTWRRVVRIGAEDHLIRSVSTAPLAEGGWTFRTARPDDGMAVRELAVDDPIPDAAFAFRPPKGAIPTAPPRYRPRTDDLNVAAARVSSALHALRSLSFTDELTIETFDADGRRVARRRATLRFDLQRPLRFRGELGWNGAKAGSEIAVCDGLTFAARGERTDLGQRDRDPYSTAAFGIERAFAAAPAASAVAAQFFDADARSFRGLVPAEGGKPSDALEWIVDVVDGFGIPTGIAEYERYFVDPKDRLPRRYESLRTRRPVGVFDPRRPWDGWTRVTERFVRIVPNATFDPKRFVVPLR